MTVKLKVERGAQGPIVVIPPHMAKLPAFQPGAEVELSAENEPTLSEILDQITPEQLHGEVGFGKPVGKEW